MKANMNAFMKREHMKFFANPSLLMPNAKQHDIFSISYMATQNTRHCREKSVRNANIVNDAIINASKNSSDKGILLPQLLHLPPPHI